MESAKKSVNAFKQFKSLSQEERDEKYDNFMKKMDHEDLIILMQFLNSSEDLRFKLFLYCDSIYEKLTADKLRLTKESDNNKKQKY